MTAARSRPLPPVSRILALHLLALGALLPGGPSLRADSAPGVPMLAGELGGARFAIARPASWNGNVLLYAHGFRSEKAPLSAEFDVGRPVFARLLREGWIVAATSYRRNGVVVRDAIDDLGALRDHIEQTEGRLGLVVLLGESMGGTVVTLMAENEPDRFHGALAVGAALDLRDARYPLALTRAPKLPILFLANRTELAGPESYVAAAARAPVPPALWSVARDGHVNVNDQETTAALEGLIGWITTNRIERRRDATVALEGAGTAIVAGGVARGAVQSVTKNHGNLFTTFVPADFAKLGIAKGAPFELVVGDATFRVLYAGDYGDVAPGEWVAFPRAEGVVLLARNGENAAATAGVKAGDALVVRPLTKR